MPIAARPLPRCSQLIFPKSFIALANIFIDDASITIAVAVDITFLIGKGLVTLAGAFTILGVAGLVLQPLVPSILGLSASFALLGIAVLGRKECHKNIYGSLNKSR